MLQRSTEITAVQLVFVNSVPHETKRRFAAGNARKGSLPVASASVAPKTGLNVDHLLQAFAKLVGQKLAAPMGEPEDQLRGPFESLVRGAGALIGLDLNPVGEASRWPS